MVAAGLIFRSIRTGGWSMLKMMGGSPKGAHDHVDHDHDKPTAMTG
jgi:hypothetical protein